MERLNEIGFPGMALGGLSVGEKNEEMQEFLNDFVHTMPIDKPRYLMGVGKPLDVLYGIKCGLDMFDCVLPTRNARNGQAFTKYGPINIKKEKFKEDKLPLDPEGNCANSQKYSRAYIRHLFNVGEYLGAQILTYHNLWFYMEMVKNAREAIIQGKFDDYYKQFYKDFTSNRWS